MTSHGPMSTIRGCLPIVFSVLVTAGQAAPSICVDFKAKDALIADGGFADLDHPDGKSVKLESRGGPMQKLEFNGTWELSRNAQLDDIKAITVPMVMSAGSDGLILGVFLYNLRTRGWKTALSPELGKKPGQYVATITDWQDYYDPKTRQIRFEIRASTNTSTPITVTIDQLSIRPVWRNQQISHELAEKVAAGGGARELNADKLDAGRLAPSLEMRRPQPQPGERFRAAPEAPVVPPAPAADK